jgi:glycosyltransferase involved in cell wall biosynthesis
MRILFIHEVDWINKVVYDLHSLAELLSLLGHQVYAIDYENAWRRNGLLDFGTLNTKEFEGVSRAFSGSSVHLKRPGFIKIPAVSRLSASVTQSFEIRRTIRDEKIDAVVLYSVPTNGLQTIYLARKFNVPVVFRSIDILHQLVPHSMLRPAYKIEALSRLSDAVYRLVTHHILRPATKILEKLVYSKVDEILAITPHHSRYVIDMGAPEARVKLLPLPIDTNLFRPSVDCSAVRQRWGLSETDKIIVFVGTLFEFSGLDGFIREMPQIVQRIPETKLLIVGDGAQRRKLESLVAELGLQRYVIITGFEPYQTMPQYMNAATVCINPFLVENETKDIFPGKVIQYISCGKATVATPLLGITTLLPDESKGIVYASNAKEMAAKVVWLLESPEVRKRLELAGLDYIKQNHDHMMIGRQLESYLQRCVEDRRGGRN